MEFLKYLVLKDLCGNENVNFLLMTDESLVFGGDANVLKFGVFNVLAVICVQFMYSSYI